MKFKEDERYLRKIPIRFIRIALLYIAVLLLKIWVNENPFSGGILWINCLLLSYAVFYLAHLIGGGHGDCVVIVFGVLYTIIARIYPNPYFGWPSQALGFAYGSIFAIFSDGLIRLFVEKIK